MIPVMKISTDTIFSLQSVPAVYLVLFLFKPMTLLAEQIVKLKDTLGTRI